MTFGAPIILIDLSNYISYSFFPGTFFRVYFTLLPLTVTALSIVFIYASIYDGVPELNYSTNLVGSLVFLRVVEIAPVFCLQV